MSSPPENINDIAKAIQLALGPVFLLTAIAGLLNVMSGRLSRIINRGRVLTEGTNIIVSISKDKMNATLELLERRRRFTSVAITMCTIAALLVCLVIVTLFLEVMLNIPLNWVIGGLFIIATLALVAGLAFFLREVHISAKTSRITGVTVHRS